MSFLKIQVSREPYVTHMTCSLKISIVLITHIMIALVALQLNSTTCITTLWVCFRSDKSYCWRRIPLLKPLTWYWVHNGIGEAMINQGPSRSQNTSLLSPRVCVRNYLLKHISYLEHRRNVWQLNSNFMLGKYFCPIICGGVRSAYTSSYL